VIRRLRAWWRRRRTPRPVPTEICEVCGQFLADEDVWELRSDSMSEGERAEMRELGITSGGTWMSATYCAEHFPADRERWRP
jgi:hypothetical protein